MKLLIISFLISQIAVSISWANEIRVLTSFNSSRESRKIEKKIEKEFNRVSHLIDFKIRIIHQAGPHELDSSLMNQNVIGLIWFSHGQGSEGLGGIKKNSILDFKGRDLSSFFKKDINHLDFVSVITCYSAMLDLSKNLENKMRITFPDKIKFTKGLSQTIKELVDFRFNPRESKERESEELPLGNPHTLTLLLEFSKPIEEDIVVRVKKEILAVIPKGSRHFSFQIPHLVATKRGQIVLDSLLSPSRISSSLFDFKISLQANWLENWFILKKPNGDDLGYSFRLIDFFVR